MKRCTAWIITVGCVLLLSEVRAQIVADEVGFDLGIFRFQPVIEALAAYDSRVIDETADDDVYGEAEAFLRIDNTEARYDVGGWASYGYRSYDKYNELNDDFYGAGAGFASREGRLKSGLSAYVKKTLDYDVNYDEDRELGAILTPSTSRRGSATFDLGYERQLTEKSAVMPMYQGWYYFQDFEGRQDEEWQEHSAILRYGYGMSSRMVVTLSGSYEIQLEEEENGSITEVSVGAKSRATDKLDWSATVGVSAADYELSGTDEGFVGSLKLNWQATDKVSTYAFGRSGYQPGGQSSGGAKKVFRAGYGANWAIVEKIKLDLQILHDYEDSIQGEVGTANLSDLNNFVTARVVYDISRNIAFVLSGRFIDDEREEDQTVISGKIVLTY
jgi:hypothetical protein